MNSVNPLKGAGAAGVEAAAVIEAVLPGVVQVRRGTRRRGPRGGAGAGFLWSPDGSVMTNHHVVAGSDGKLEVVLTDDRSFDAEVVESSRRLDLAMLRLRGAPAEDLATPPVGDSNALRVGELVFAVGHPWGRRGAVTAGIVSGLGSVGRPFGRARYVQSDAYLAPGNSGGPLVNARGEVIGVNAMISRGLSLAIPINTAGAWASGGVRTGRRSRPRLGVRVQEAVLPASSRDPAGQEAGLVIVGVASGGPASRAGLLVGDVLLGVAGEPVEDAAALRDALARAGDPVRLRVMRGGEVREVEAGFGDSGRARARGA
ncbi:MAG: S1C family serine protease [Actinomycetota bacterium]|nr:S1C family serine protease [Actinomycetota bacterium]